MDRIKKLNDERNGLIEANDNIIASAVNDKEEVRAFTDEEKTDMANNETRITEIDEELEVLQRQEDRKKAIATREAAKAAVAAAASGDKPTDGEQKEIQKRFSMTKFVRGVLKGKQDGFEEEMANEGDKTFEASKAQREHVAGKSFIIPNKVLEARNIRSTGRELRAPMKAGTAGEAGNAIATELRSFIDLLQSNLVLAQAGADFQTGLVGNIDWPTEATVATATWEGEVDANAESTPTTGKVSMSPKRLGTFVDISNQAIIQTSPSIDARINGQMVGAVRRAVDTAGINGSGVAPIPEGILQTSGIGAVALGANGADPTWDSYVKLEEEVDVDDALLGALSYVGNAKVRSKSKRVFVDSPSGERLMDREGLINGYPAYFSNLVPSDLVKGTSGAVCSALIFGNFNDLIIGQWGGLEVLVDPYTQATTGTTRLVINGYFDVAVLRAVSFAAITDMLTT